MIPLQSMYVGVICAVVPTEATVAKAADVAVFITGVVYVPIDGFDVTGLIRCGICRKNLGNRKQGR